MPSGGAAGGLDLAPASGMLARPETVGTPGAAADFSYTRRNEGTSNE
jgi:hypothetical protein